MSLRTEPVSLAQAAVHVAKSPTSTSRNIGSLRKQNFESDPETAGLSPSVVDGFFSFWHKSCKFMEIVISIAPGFG
jgi:hypothetical protein